MIDFQNFRKNALKCYTNFNLKNNFERKSFYKNLKVHSRGELASEFFK